jgi:hypothetical protein
LPAGSMCQTWGGSHKSGWLGMANQLAHCSKPRGSLVAQWC